MAFGRGLTFKVQNSEFKVINQQSIATSVLMIELAD